MASTECEPITRPITGPGGKAPGGVHGRAAGQGGRETKPPNDESSSALCS